MLSEVDRHIVHEFKQRLSADVPILDLRVFGSRTRGDFTDESDLDLFIEVEVLTPQVRRRIFEIAWEVGFERDRVISTFVASSDQIKAGPLAANPILLEIENEGVRL